MSDYWKGCIQEAFEDAGIVATNEQIELVASWVEGSHENYGTAHGYDCIPNPLETENEKLRESLKRERNKAFCKECNGAGRITENFANRSSNTSCHRCNGEGKI